MIYIVGAAHSLQIWTQAVERGESLDTSLKLLRNFQRYLERQARKFRATLLAEELSAEAVARRGPDSYSTMQQSAERLGVPHLFCDPNSAERLALGLGNDAQSFSRRELVWIERLAPVLCEPDSAAIFVCGAEHVSSFRSKLPARDIPAEILIEDWAMRRQPGVAGSQ
jgi:hypothetical protein